MGNRKTIPSSLPIKEAQANGTAVVETSSGPMFLIAPRVRGEVAPAPFEKAEHLLDPPQARAAYSDRTAWLMAACAKLAYLSFEGDANVKKQLVTSLSDAGLHLLTTFDVPETGTQAFLALRPANAGSAAFMILAFRGTEKNRKDIMADLDARFYQTPEGKSHRGFTRAFESVEKSIRAALDEAIQSITQVDSGSVAKPCAIFITGHSLGGALATVATQTLENDYFISACYTFGSPRVGTAEWSDYMKTPIYRVVNSADGIPLVPASSITRDVLVWTTNLPFLAMLKGPINRFADSGFMGFQHAGDLRFLGGGIKSTQLKIGSAATLARLQHVFVGILGKAVTTFSARRLSATFRDHAISLYVDKLRQIADARNPKG